MLVDVELGIRRRQDLALVDVIHLERFENAGFGEMADAGFGHHRNADVVHDLADLANGGHAGHAAFFTDVRRHPLQGHDGCCAGLLRDHRLLGVGDVHDDAAF